MNLDIKKPQQNFSKWNPVIYKINCITTTEGDLFQVFKGGLFKNRTI